MVCVEESVHIDQTPEAVWAAIADYGYDRRWRRGLFDMTPDPPGPPAVGTRVHEVVRQPGRDYVADTVVTELEPGASYRFEGVGTIGGLTGGRTVAPEPRGARFTYTIELEPAGGTRLLGPVLGPIVRSGLRKDLRALKDLLEGGG